mmetsp:Transcript_1180/g.2856  ORF Transcript_1180/g.2856 Transcript_1180/m.2856 type:complete len:346 (+) Transcript_1180:1502-2539(+)
MLNLLKLAANSDPCQLEVTIVSLKIFFTQQQSLRFVVKRGKRKQETTEVAYLPENPTVTFHKTLIFPLTMYRSGGKYLHKSVKFRLVQHFGGRECKGGKAKVELKEIEPNGHSCLYDLKLDNSPDSVLRVSVCMCKMTDPTTYAEDSTERFQRAFTVLPHKEIDISQRRMSTQPYRERIVEQSFSTAESEAPLPQPKPYILIETQTQTKPKLSVESDIGIVDIEGRRLSESKLPESVRDVLDNITAHMLSKKAKAQEATESKSPDDSPFRAITAHISKKVKEHEVTETKHPDETPYRASTSPEIPISHKGSEMLGKHSKSVEITKNERRRGLGERTGSCAACLLF